MTLLSSTIDEVEIDPSAFDGIDDVRICVGCGNAFLAKQHNQTRCKPHCASPDRHINRVHACDKPFLAVDGEGGGTNDKGQQNYLLMCAAGVDGDAYQLFEHNRRLTTKDCLDFILALPSDHILVGFFFDYDVTQIMRDLPLNRITRLLEPRVLGGTNSPWTEWEGYLLQYVPRQFFRVMREGKKGSCRTINEVGGFFQKSFVNVIREWNVCDQSVIDEINSNKMERPEFTKITPRIRDYCESECRLLSEVMNRLRDRLTVGSEQVSHLKAGISMVPRAWRGAGYVAARILESTGTPKTEELPLLPGKLGNMMKEAYYGGHFEISRTGLIDQPVYEYDINSAYPAAMSSLPCPLHTLWNRVSVPPKSELYVADLQFRHAKGTLWAGFPFRTKTGHLCWPLAGSGVYWSPEIKAAQELSAKVKYNEIWAAEKACQCTPFDWVEPLYEFRKSLGKGTEGYPIKLGLNAMYGKLAQRAGKRIYHNLIHAGLITAITRAKLLNAVAHDPGAVVMLATDGVYSIRPLPLDIGVKLGTWECKEHPNMFIVQPGMYWFPGSENSHKTRGIPKSVIQENADAFLKTWDHFGLQGSLFPDVLTVPSDFLVKVKINSFIGTRLALARNKPEIAGKWVVTTKKVSFDWSNKRGIGLWNKGSTCITHLPFDGNVSWRSQPYDPSLLTEIEGQTTEFEGNPDHVEWVTK